MVLMKIVLVKKKDVDDGASEEEGDDDVEIVDDVEEVIYIVMRPERPFLRVDDVKWLKRISKNIGIYPKNVVISVIRGVGLISNIQKVVLIFIVFTFLNSHWCGNCLLLPSKEE